MGNRLACLSPAPASKPPSSSSPKVKDRLPPWLSSPASTRKLRKQEQKHQQSSSPPPTIDDSYVKQQAQIASMLYHQHLQNSGGRDLLLQLERSVSTRNPYRAAQHRNSSKRSRSVSSSNPISASLPLVNKDSVVNKDRAESKHLVLVHGGGFGAWCWYKIIALLKESHCQVDAIDLTGSGSNFCNINSITSLTQYASPLTHFLEDLPGNKQVILVGHALGGACVSYAMEMYPGKVSKAVFVAATMLRDGQSALDIFSQQSALSHLNQRAQKFLYANGKHCQPTAIEYDGSLMEDFLFNKSPSKDIALASVSMRTIPFAPVADKLTLSAANYGSIPRFYVKTDEDFAMPQALQEAMIQSSPPTQVLELRGSDHSPFFSRPQALHKFLLEISDLPKKS